MAATDFDVVLKKVIYSLYGETFNLKPEQTRCIKAVCCDNRDVFAQLPTGFGKSVIYQAIPRAKSALLSGETGRSNMKVIVVSPLVQIMEEQVKDLLKCGVKAGRIGESPDSDAQIEKGDHEVIFANAEQWQSSRWKAYLRRSENIAAFVVDEVHTVMTW